MCLAQLGNGGADERHEAEEVDVESGAPVLGASVGEARYGIEGPVVQDEAVDAGEGGEGEGDGFACDLDCHFTVSSVQFRLGSGSKKSLDEALTPRTLERGVQDGLLARRSDAASTQRTAKSAKSPTRTSTCPGYCFFSSSSGPAVLATTTSLLCFSLSR